jgi:hypothetical protein
MAYDYEEKMAQRNLLDTLLATETTAHEHKASLELMDALYFQKDLPENVILFPFHKVRRINVPNKPTKQPRKKNI